MASFVRQESRCPPADRYGSWTFVDKRIFFRKMTKTKAKEGSRAISPEAAKNSKPSGRRAEQGLCFDNQARPLQIDLRTASASRCPVQRPLNFSNSFPFSGEMAPEPMAFLSLGYNSVFFIHRIDILPPPWKERTTHP